MPPEMLERILRVCEGKNLQKPSCYQGDYNLITKGMETELLPLLRSNGMTFNAFRTLAAGFLTGRFVNNEHEGTRFGDNDPLGNFAQELFGAEDLHSVMRTFGDEAKSYNQTPVDVAIRWIMYHSALGDQDAIIIGASKAEQVWETVNMMKKGPLPEELLKAVGDLWNAVKESRHSII